MWRATLILLLGVGGAAGCVKSEDIPAEEGDSADPCPPGYESDECPSFDPDIAVLWDTGSVSITFGGDPNAWGRGDFRWGIVETGVECGEDCYTAEDCLHGGESTSGEPLQWCHSFSEAESDTLLYGGDPDTLPDSSTAFDQSAGGKVTVYLQAMSTGECWVMGADHAYYTGLGCEWL